MTTEHHHSSMTNMECLQATDTSRMFSTLSNDITPLDNKADPYHVLAAAAADGFIQTRNNWVKYYECIEDGKGMSLIFSLILYLVLIYIH